MKATLQPGLEGRTRHVVTAELGTGHSKHVVLSTPSMIGLIELACKGVVEPHLEATEATVGTHVCVSHERAALKGDQIDVLCRLREMAGRRLKFDVEVEGPAGRISVGTHERAVTLIR